MPGHKGTLFSGSESSDITEISGADNLFSANGIIKKSEDNASRLFGCRTFYSAEGSSLCIRAMLYLILLYAKSKNSPPVILAGRNVHKTFVTAAALLDIDVRWLFKDGGSYLSCSISAEDVENSLKSQKERPSAVYLTAPDYLGNMPDLRPISAVCKRYGVLLAVDCAHGSYLKFLPESLFPTDLGADICCSSAHKTLPSLTGGAYLHISENAPSVFSEKAEYALSFFASTSPSYLILRSLDRLNPYLENYAERLNCFISELEKLKKELSDMGYVLYGNEPLKMTVMAKKYGYTGKELAEILESNNVYCEFADNDFLVMMFAPEIKSAELKILSEVLGGIPKKEEINAAVPLFSLPKKKLSLRDAAMSESETVSVVESLGHTVASLSVSCPPAVPVIMCGEIVDENVLGVFRYYGIKNVETVKENNL